MDPQPTISPLGGAHASPSACPQLTICTVRALLDCYPPAWPWPEYPLTPPPAPEAQTPALPNDPSAPPWLLASTSVSHSLCHLVQALFEAGENRVGTVCSVLIDVLTSRSEAQLCKIFQYYAKYSKQGFAKALESELHGNLEECLMTLVKSAWSKPSYFAEKLHLAMKGLGTNTHTLTRIIVSRSEIDLLKIIEEYKRMYGKSLQEAILKETSGDYEKILLTLCGTQ